MIASLVLASWIFWLVWMAAGLAYEIPAVFLEKKDGMLPLTRVIRDRLMRKSTVIRWVVLAFLTWLWFHFNLNLP